MKMDQEIKSHALWFAGENFEASLNRSLFHAASRSLLIADCHFGKMTHFRKNNFPIPVNAALKDYHILQNLLHHYQPVQCIFLGDLFHSEHNQEWDLLSKVIEQHPKTSFKLVEGNHDILAEQHYASANIEMMNTMSLPGSIILSHEPLEISNSYNICGHIHPGFLISGKGRQHIGLPCFYEKGNCLILPSFGTLTGKVSMNQHKPGKALCFTKNEFYYIENY